jgi:hypothetical protein
MTLTITDLNTLNQQQVEQMRQLLTQLLSEYNPNAGLEMGPTQDLIVTPKAVLDTATQNNINLVVQSSSLAAIVANPALGDPTTVANLLSNYGITPTAAAPASGNVTILLSTLIPTVIPSTTVFTISGQTFQPAQTYSARVSSTLVQLSTDVLISQLGNYYAFTIPVTAVTAGSAGNVTLGSPATLSQNPGSFVSAYASTSFSGGTDAESNSQLVTQLQSGLAAKAWGNRVTAAAQITQQFPSVTETSIIGFGDPEMLRDEHSIWPGHTGGRTDTYIQTAPIQQYVTVTETATLIATAGNVGTWQFQIARDDAPGFYEVTQILTPSMPLTAQGFLPASDVRGFDLSIDSTHTYIPDIISPLEAAYTEFQTSTITFIDTVTSVSGLTVGVATAPYQVVMSLMPQIDTIQAFLGLRTNRPPMGDVLVRGAVPCFTGVSLTLNVISASTLTVAAVQAALASAVNSQGFVGSLAASFINQVLHNLAGTSLVSVSGLSMTGRIRRPDGVNVFVNSSTVLSVPSSPQVMSTANTVLFLLSPSNVAVNLVTVSS